MMNDLTADELMVLERIVTKSELQPYFFGKVKSLKWFNPLKNKGLLAPLLNPKPVNTADGYRNVPSWPVTEYLVRSAEMLMDDENVEIAQEYMDLIREVSAYAIANNYSNYRTWWQFCKVLRNLPLSLISTDDLQHVRYWLDDSFDNHLVGKEVSEWIVDLVGNDDEGSKTLALHLLDVLFTINRVEGKYTNNKVEASLRLDGYQTNEYVKKSAYDLGKQLGLAAVELFEKKFTEVLEINGNDKWSNIWRNSIAGSEESSRNDDANQIVLNFFRNSLLGYFQSNLTQESKEKLIDIISSDYETIRRIGIYVASEFFYSIDEKIVALVIESKNFNDKYRHELWHFLNKHFTELSKLQQTSIIESISGLMVKNDETGAIEDKPTAYKQSNWYAAIKDVSDVANTNYQQCIAITGVEPDHPDFSCYTSSWVSGHSSPLTVTELAVMLENPSQLVSFLNEYEHVGHFGEPGLEGLVETFGELILLDDCLVLNNLEYFIVLKPHYLNEIFSSYSKLWSDKKQRLWESLWPKLLNFAYNLFQKDSFWQSPDNNESGPFIGDRHWVVSTYCRLVESGCEKDARAFDINLSDTVKSTLELILKQESGSDFDNDSDAISVAINSSRGRCLEAYFKLALYQCRNVEKDSDERQKIWETYEPVFSNELNKPETANEYEFITLVVMYMRNFLYLSKSWTYENLDKMFKGGNTSLQWLCAVQAYSYVGALLPEIHEIFKEKNDYVSILDTPHLNDTVKGRYVEYMCIAHIQKIENIDDDDSLLKLLLSRKNEKELSKVIWYLWSIRDKKLDIVKELIFHLWPKLLELIEQQVNGYKKLASKLALWSEYIEELNEQNMALLSPIAPFIDEDHNAMSFMEELARLSTNNPLDAGELWKAALVNPVYVYNLSPFEQLFKNLIAQGEEGNAAAKEIAEVYIKNCDEAVVQLYRGINKD